MTNNFVSKKWCAAENEDSDSDAVEIGVRMPANRTNINKFAGKSRPKN